MNVVLEKRNPVASRTCEELTTALALGIDKMFPQSSNSTSAHISLKAAHTARDSMLPKAHRHTVGDTFFTLQQEYNLRLCPYHHVTLKVLLQKVNTLPNHVA